MKYFIHYREATIYFIDMREEFNGKLVNGLLRFSGKVHLIVYFLEDKVRPYS